MILRILIDDKGGKEVGNETGHWRPIYCVFFVFFLSYHCAAPLTIHVPMCRSVVPEKVVGGILPEHQSAGTAG
jgi:hypothetical protein